MTMGIVKNSLRLLLSMYAVLLPLGIISVESATSIEGKKRILSFGGNGMIGSTTLSMLIATNEYDITLVSRGSWPFDTSSLIAPHVRSIRCNRKRDLVAHCQDLIDEIDSTDEFFAVLDFSGYYPEWVEDSVEVLKDKARVYVYISTDSVYEVVEKGSFLETGQKSVESDAVRPANQDLREELSNKDAYGDEKLACEEVLVEQRGAGRNQGIPYVFLRFADIVGPRDDTGRFLTYYSWIKFHNMPSIPNIALYEDLVEGTSITYVKDAAKSILSAIDNENSWDEAFNIACVETFNVTSQIMALGHMMGKRIRPVKRSRPKSRRKSALFVYPSVKKGPMDMSKAIERLGFVPTSQEMAFLETLTWYEDWFQKDEDFREDVVDELIYILDSTTEYESDEERDEIIDMMLEEISQREQQQHGDNENEL